MVPRRPTPSRGDPASYRRRLLFPAVLVAVLVLASCYTFGDESSWIRVQNMGQEDASFSIQLLSETGQVVGEHVCPSQACPTLAPGAAFTLPLEGVSSFPEGVLGSAIVTSDQPLAVLMVSDVDRGEGRFQSAGDTLSTVSVGGRLYLPLMMRGAGPGGDWNGRLVVQNISTNVVACLTLVYLSDDGAGAYWDPYDPARPPAERLAGCPNGGFPLQPGASTFRDVLTMPPPAPFSGAVRIDVHTNGQGGLPAAQTIVASAGLWNENSMHFGSYRALREEELGYTVLLPLIERQAFGFWSTRFQVQNRDPSIPVRVNLRIQGWDRGQDPPQAVAREGEFIVGATMLCDQDDPSADCLAPEDVLPLNFVGSAVLTASQPIGVVVSRGMWAQDWYGTYRGVAAQRAATRLYLPLVVKNAQSADRTGEHSAIHIQVADGGSAEVTIRYRAPELAGGEVRTHLTVSGSGTTVPDRLALLPAGFVGGAVLESDRPIVAVVDVITGDFTGDPFVMYNGVLGP